MSTPNAKDQKTPPPPSSGLGIGLIIGGIVLAMLIVAAIVYVMKKRSNGGGYVPSGAPTSANGLGVMNQGSNPVNPTTMYMNAGKGPTV